MATKKPLCLYGGSPKELQAGDDLGVTGKVLQRAYYQTGAVATGTNIIPGDDSIPQITEGTEFMTLSFTPVSATSTIHIKVCMQLASSALSTMAAALFQDTTANALATATVQISTSGWIYSLTFSTTVSSGSISTRTFRVRAGNAAAGTTTFNGSGGTRYYGGSYASGIEIVEYAP